MRILVTGGAGFVGKRLTRLLSKQQHEVLIIDSLRYDPSCRIAFDQSIRIEQADIRDQPSIRSIIQNFQPESIIHLSAIHFIPECEQKPELAISINVLGTSILCSLCPPGCRFVFASSGAVYTPENQPHDELTSPTGPLDIYGWTKRQGEDYVRYFAKTRSFPGAIVRLFNVIGPGETNPHVLPEIVAQLKAGKRTLQLGNLTPKRDYIHVDDVASGFASVATQGQIHNGDTTVVNLGTGSASSVSDLLEHLKAVSGIPIEIQTDPMRTRASDRPFLSARSDRIRDQFGWVPRMSLRDALVDLWHSPELPESWIDKYR